jgi:protein-disulfide isomerase
MALFSLSLFAAGVDVAAIRAYTQKALQKCPDAKLDFNQVQSGGPISFVMFEAKLESSDKNCTQHKYVLYSPVTQQILICNVFELPAEGGSVEGRIASLSSQMLNANITAKVGGLPLPDGLRAVSMTKQTKLGPFSYHGFVDGSGSFLIVGERGNLREEPGLALRKALNVDVVGVHRGSKTSKVEIIELSDFECPTCARAHKKVEPIIEKNMSKINYTRIDLPLFEHHEWAIYAALGAHAIQKVAPAKYWSYVNFVFENQETIGKTEFATVLKDFCTDHDINWEAVKKIYLSPTERQAILEQVSRAFDVGVNSTPTYIVNGQMMGFGPEGEFTIAEIKKAIGVK